MDKNTWVDWPSSKDAHKGWKQMRNVQSSNGFAKSTYSNKKEIPTSPTYI